MRRVSREARNPRAMRRVSREPLQHVAAAVREGEALKLTGTSSGTAYHFRPTDSMGWAICTVNDATGELQIMSDWGDWSYRWTVRALGPGSDTAEPLTRFLADPGHKHDNYLADKLTSSDRSKRESFD